METTLYQSVIPETPAPGFNPTTAAPVPKRPPKTSAPPTPRTPRPVHPMTFGQGAALIIILVLGLFVFPFIKSSFDSVVHQEWEYQIVSVKDQLFEIEINKLGAGGWELVFARRATTGKEYDPAAYEMIFKRPKKL